MTNSSIEAGAIDIRPVHSRSDLNTFIRLPNRLYAEFKEYVPPLTMEMADLLDPKKGSFFKHGKAQYWLAYKNGLPVGRISAQIDHAQPEGTFDDAGLFGCFDAIDDQDVASQLFAAAEAWLVAQGRMRAMGPFTLTINEVPGLLVEGQAEPPLLMVLWHPPYLEALVTGAGYASCRDLHYWRLDDLENAGASLFPYLTRLRNIKGVELRQLQRKHLARDVKMMTDVFNDAWQDNWGFVPALPEDADVLVRSLRMIAKPEDGLLMTYNGALAGMAVIAPNLFEITSDLGPDPSPIGWLKLVYRIWTHRYKGHRYILLGLNSQYRTSQIGPQLSLRLSAEMIAAVLRHKDKSGYIEAGWVLDINVPLRKILVGFGFSQVRTLRLYDKVITGGQEEKLMTVAPELLPTSWPELSDPDLLERLIDIIAEDGAIDRDLITPEATLETLGLGSMDVVMILMGVEEKLDAYLPMDAEMASARNLSEFVASIESAMKNGAQKPVSE